MGGLNKMEKRFKWKIWDRGTALDKGNGDFNDLEEDIRRLKKLKLGL